MVSKDKWRVNGKYVDKGPFPEPTTDVQVQEKSRDDNTGEVCLKITPVHGDMVYYDVGPNVTANSPRVEDLHAFKISEMEISFLCVDSSGQHETGQSSIWKNRITLKKKIHGDNSKKHVELQSAPPGAVIRYSTDGSNPQTSGGLYDGSFIISKPTRMVLAVAEKNGVYSEQLKVPITGPDEDDKGIIIDLSKKAKWNCEHKQTTTKESFDFIEGLKKYDGKLSGPTITIAGDKWLELSVNGEIYLNADQIETMIDNMRNVYNEGQVNIEAFSLLFPAGQDLIDFAAYEKKNINANEVEQL